MKFSNVHTHTVFSDGKNTPLEMAREGEKLGMVSLGFSDHSEMMLGLGENLKSDGAQDYIREVGEVKKRMEGTLEIFCGIEKDFYTELSLDPYEYAIGSVHFIRSFDGTFYPLDHSGKQLLDCMDHCAKGDLLEGAKRYYDLVVTHAQKSTFQIQGHFDLINKFGFYDEPTKEYQKVALEALDEVLENVPYIEVNTGAIARGYRTRPYPEDFLLERILERGGKLVLNGDSHKVEHLLCHYEESVKKLKKMGFSSLWQLRKTGFEKVEL